MGSLQENERKEKFVSSVDILLLLVSFLLTLFAAEIGVRWLHLSGSDNRSLMFSSPTFQLDTNGAVRLVPNETIRTVTVYNREVEYDVKFNTNNFGLVDDRDYSTNDSLEKMRYAFVGDSFTAGFHSGKPWVSELRKDVEEENYEIYNLGINGAGVEHFFRLLKSVNEQLNFTHIVILGISDDFKRKFWYPLANASEIRFCRENIELSECYKRNYIAKIIPFTSSKKDIMEVSDVIEEDRKERYSRIWIKSIWRQSELFVLAEKALRAHKRKEARPANFRYSMDALKKIREYFPTIDIKFIHLPQKNEVSKGGYLLEGVEREVEKLGITYFSSLEECSWDESMFYVHDTHPNRYGYDNIRECVSRYLF